MPEGQPCPLPPSFMAHVGGRGTNCWRSTKKELELQKAEAMVHLIRLYLRGSGGRMVCQALPWEPSVNRGRLMPRATAAR